MNNYVFSYKEVSISEIAFGVKLVSHLKYLIEQSDSQIKPIKKIIHSIVRTGEFELSLDVDFDHDVSVSYKKLYLECAKENEECEKKILFDKFFIELIKDISSLRDYSRKEKIKSMGLTPENVLMLVKPASFVCGESFSHMTPSELFEKTNCKPIGFDFVSVLAKKDGDELTYLNSIKLPPELIYNAIDNMENELLFDANVICFEDKQRREVVMVGMSSENKSLNHSFIISPFYRKMAMDQLGLSSLDNLRCVLSIKDYFCAFFSEYHTDAIDEVVSEQEPGTIVAFKFNEVGTPIQDEIIGTNIRRISEVKYGHQSQYMQ